MSDNVQLPALGESVTEGTVTRWLKNVGDRVEVDEPLLEISTDKVDTEIPSPFAGVLEQILVQEDETVEVGATLAVIGSGEGSGGSDAAPAEQPAEQAQEAPAEQAPAEQAPAEQAPAEQAPAEEPAAEQQPTQSAEEHEQAAPAAEQPAAGGQSGEEVTLPALGESVTEGTVTRWLKAVGDSVEVDEPLLEISTDKVDTEIPSPVAGTVQQILVQEDETVEVGAVLAIVGSGAAPAAAPSAPAQEAPAQEQAPAQEAPAPQPAPGPAPAQESATPAPVPA
ncbi:biotin/lipoyl-containing protein, partial [Cellulomonas biazotea]